MEEVPNQGRGKQGWGQSLEVEEVKEWTLLESPQENSSPGIWIWDFRPPEQWNNESVD